MGKKRVTYDFNDNEPPNHAIIDHHHHHRHHHNHQKSKKIKPEAKLLHTLNSHLKKLAKSRSRNTHSFSTPRPVTKVSLEKNNKHRHGSHLSWLKQDYKDHHYDWFMGFDYDYDHDHDHEDKVFEFNHELRWKTISYIGTENNEDLFGGDYVFEPDLINSSHNMVVVFEEDGSRYGSYIPDPITNLDNGDEGMYLCDMLELWSQEDMINEFLKVNLFVS